MRFILSACFVFLAAFVPAAAKPYPTTDDSYLACIKQDGARYFVNAPAGRCAPGDAATRCLLPNGQIVATRGIENCHAERGRALGRDRN